MKKITRITILLALCLNWMIFECIAEEPKFVKIDGGLGLKNDGTLWKLHIETDGMISPLEFRYDILFDDDIIDFRIPEDYDEENEQLRQLFRHGENIVDFSAYTIPVSEVNKEFRLKGLVTKNTDGIWSGYASNFYGITRLNLIDVKTQAAGCYANVYTDSNGDSYIYGGPVGSYLPTPLIINDLKNAISISHGMRNGFAVDSSGKIYSIAFYTDDNAQRICYAKELTIEDHHVLPDEKVKYIKFDNNSSTVMLSENNHVYLMLPGREANYVCRKIDLDNVVEVDINVVPDFEWYKTNIGGSDISLYGGSNLVMLCADGTVWQTNSIETYPKEDADYQSTMLRTTLPVQIHGVSDVVGIDVLADDILMLKADGSIIKWGTASYKDMHTDNPQKIETRNYNIALEIGKETMYINGEDKEIDPGRGTKSIEQNGRTYIPIRALVENIGGSIAWDELGQKVSIRLWGDELEMQIGSEKYCLNGEARQMDVCPIIENDRTMVPIRFVGEAFGFTVDYDENPLTAKLFYREILE